MIGVGVLAGLFYDSYNVLVHVLFGISIEYHMIGLWVLHLMTGDFIYRGIPQLAAMPYENLVGWLVHYAVAITYSVFYLSLVFYVFRTRPRWYTAVLFSWTFMLVPFLVTQPAMGQGCFASLSASPGLTCLITVSFHTVFGLSLYFSYRIMDKLISFEKR